MAYIGIGYSGEKPDFLHDLVDRHGAWLRADRVPRFFGERFVVLYDSNTAREFAKKCCAAADKDDITVFPMDRPLP